jgi:preprotein translocase subunit SecG
MYQLVLLIHVFVAVCIVALVLVQQGKGATMGAAFGSGASSTVFGSRGSGSFLFRVTMGFVAVFFVTSITLNYMASRAYKAEKVIVLPSPVKTDDTAKNLAPDAQIPVKNAAPVAPAVDAPITTKNIAPGKASMKLAPDAEIPVKK